MTHGYLLSNALAYAGATALYRTLRPTAPLAQLIIVAASFAAPLQLVVLAAQDGAFAGSAGDAGEEVGRRDGQFSSTEGGVSGGDDAGGAASASLPPPSDTFWTLNAAVCCVLALVVVPQAALRAAGARTWLVRAGVHVACLTAVHLLAAPLPLWAVLTLRIEHVVAFLARAGAVVVAGLSGFSAVRFPVRVLREAGLARGRCGAARGGTADAETDGLRRAQAAAGLALVQYAGSCRRWAAAAAPAGAGGPQSGPPLQASSGSKEALAARAAGQQLSAVDALVDDEANDLARRRQTRPRQLVRTLLASVAGALCLTKVLNGCLQLALHLLAVGRRDPVDRGASPFVRWLVPTSLRPLMPAASSLFMLFLAVSAVRALRHASTLAHALQAKLARGAAQPHRRPPRAAQGAVFGTDLLMAQVCILYVSATVVLAKSRLATSLPTVLRGETRSAQLVANSVFVSAVGAACLWEGVLYLANGGGHKEKRG